LQCLPGKWDEFQLSAVTHDVYRELIYRRIDEKKYNIVIENVADVFLVDLGKVRAKKMNCLQLLSAKTRQKIRRSIRAYEEQGKVEVEIAKDRKSAQRMLADLAQLHEKSWKERGKTGSFSNPYFMKFHQELIDNCYENRELELLHVFNKHSTLGYLYNFIYDGDVLFYQCAFNFIKNNKFSPGLTSLVYAINKYAKFNYKSFNFLAGNMQYKKSLSTDCEKMYWIKIQKNKARFILERKLKEFIRKG
ncbi:MAG TPA: GNAT family N-acetyltransferase, partial [Bacteroidetes bacterium]|nr:GNAT family N-acetyltransferase [Bacteroidota bacterium]